MSSDLSPNKKITCVFVHGWAMNSAVWESCITLLPDWIDVVRIDLPGHGKMQHVEATSLDDYANVLAHVVHKPAIWVGWSLGGLVVSRIAHFYPERVAGLFLVSSTPCFVKCNDWPHAIDADVFKEFEKQLDGDTEKTIKRFLALQVQGSDVAMKDLRELQSAIKTRGMAASNALKNGLEILTQTDSREDMSKVLLPTIWFLGGKDALVPVNVSEKIKEIMPYSELIIEEKAAHVPFISHQKNFIQTLMNFAKKIINEK